MNDKKDEGGFHGDSDLSFVPNRMQYSTVSAFRDLIDVKSMQGLLDSFCKAVGVSSAIIDLEGNVIVGSNWQRICTHFHRTNPKTCVRCIESDTVLAGHMANSPEHHLYQCKNGLTDSAAPIVLEGTHLANFFVGQFLLREPDIAFFKTQAATYGFDESKYLEALEAVPIIDETRLSPIISFLKRFAETIAEMALKERRLAENERKYRIVAENTHDWEFWTDRKGAFLYSSPSCMRVTGRAVEDFADDPTLLHQIIHPADRVAYQRHETHMHDSIDPGAVSFRVLLPDGTQRWIGHVCLPVLNADGDPIGRRGSNRDITEEKKTEATLRKLTQAVEQSPSTIVITDKDGNIEYVNPKFTELTGYSRQEAMGQNPKILKSDFHDQPYYKALWDTLLSGNEWSGELLNKKKDGTFFWENAVIAPVKDDTGVVSHFIAVKEDITEKKKTLDALIASEAELKEAVQKLARSNRELEQFAYVASHDLQEPLRMVASYTELIARRYRGKLDADADEFIGFAVDGAKRMQQMIIGLLDLSRVGTRGKAPTITDCNQVVADVLRSLERSIIENHAEVVVGDLPQVLADPVQLGQVFQNLITNAIKFHSDAPPRVDISVQHAEGERPEFCVQDNGIGIAPKYQNRIFDVFQRLHGHDTYEGSGIGLAIVKKIIERHGGTIRVASEVGQGARFYFSIPAGD